MAAPIAVQPATTVAHAKVPRTERNISVPNIDEATHHESHLSAPRGFTGRHRQVNRCYLEQYPMDQPPMLI
jgi:hypothetical protein